MKNTNRHPVVVAAVSKNHNSFGYKGVIVMDDEGCAWELLWSAFTPGNPVPKPKDRIIIGIDNEGRTCYVPGNSAAYIGHSIPKANAKLAKKLWAA